MNAPKYFVICYNGLNPELYIVANSLSNARQEAEWAALKDPGNRYLITTETQSVVVQTQVNWTDK